MSALEKQNYTIDMVLELEQRTNEKYELMDGQIFLMGAAKADHGILTTSIAGLINSQFRDKPCTAIAETLHVNVGEDLFRPDLTVICDQIDLDSTVTEKPAFLVEVLSESTENRDRYYKLFKYLEIPDLKGYLLVKKDIEQIELFQKIDNKICHKIFIKGDTLIIKDWLKIKVDEIYENLNKFKGLKNAN